MLGSSIWIFRHLNCQNLSIVSDSIDKGWDDGAKIPVQSTVGLEYVITHYIVELTVIDT